MYIFNCWFYEEFYDPQLFTVSISAFSDPDRTMEFCSAFARPLVVAYWAEITLLKDV